MAGIYRRLTAQAAPPPAPDLAAPQPEAAPSLDMPDSLPGDEATEADRPVSEILESLKKDVEELDLAIQSGDTIAGGLDLEHVEPDAGSLPAGPSKIGSTKVASEPITDHSKPGGEYQSEQNFKARQEILKRLGEYFDIPENLTSRDEQDKQISFVRKSLPIIQKKDPNQFVAISALLKKWDSVAGLETVRPGTEKGVLPGKYPVKNPTETEREDDIAKRSKPPPQKEALESELKMLEQKIHDYEVEINTLKGRAIPNKENVLSAKNSILRNLNQRRDEIHDTLDDLVSKEVEKTPGQRAVEEQITKTDVDEFGVPIPKEIPEELKSVPKPRIPTREILQDLDKRESALKKMSADLEKASNAVVEAYNAWGVSPKEKGLVEVDIQRAEAVLEDTLKKFDAEMPHYLAGHKVVVLERYDPRKMSAKDAFVPPSMLVGYKDTAYKMVQKLSSMDELPDKAEEAKRLATLSEWRKRLDARISDINQYYGMAAVASGEYAPPDPAKLQSLNSEKEAAEREIQAYSDWYENVYLSDTRLPSDEQQNKVLEIKANAAKARLAKVTAELSAMQNSKPTLELLDEPKNKAVQDRIKYKKYGPSEILVRKWALQISYGIDEPESYLALKESLASERNPEKEKIVEKAFNLAKAYSTRLKAQADSIAKVNSWMANNFAGVKEIMDIAEEARTATKPLGLEKRYDPASGEMREFAVDPNSPHASIRQAAPELLARKKQLEKALSREDYPNLSVIRPKLEEELSKVNNAIREYEGLDARGREAWAHETLHVIRSQANAVISNFVNFIDLDAKGRKPINSEDNPNHRALNIFTYAPDNNPDKLYILAGTRPKLMNAPGLARLPEDRKALALIPIGTSSEEDKWAAEDNLGKIIFADDPGARREPTSKLQDFLLGVGEHGTGETKYKALLPDKMRAKLSSKDGIYALTPIEMQMAQRAISRARNNQLTDSYLLELEKVAQDPKAYEEKLKVDVLRSKYGIGQPDDFMTSLSGILREQHRKEIAPPTLQPPVRPTPVDPSIPNTKEYRDAVELEKDLRAKASKYREAIAAGTLSGKALMDLVQKQRNLLEHIKRVQSNITYMEKRHKERLRKKSSAELDKASSIDLEAVDDSAKKYYKNYYGDYGEAMVEDKTPLVLDLIEDVAEKHGLALPNDQVEKLASLLLAEVNVDGEFAKYAYLATSQDTSELVDKLLVNYIISNGMLLSDLDPASKMAFVVTAIKSAPADVRGRFEKLAESGMKVPKVSKPGKDAVDVPELKDNADDEDAMLARPAHTKIEVLGKHKDGAYLVLDLQWDPDDASADRTDSGLQQMIKSFMKGLESRKEFLDFGFMGESVIDEFDPESGLATVRVRTQKPADAPLSVKEL